jgi:hypothetical protein
MLVGYSITGIRLINFNWYMVGAVVQLGPLGTAATNCPIVPAPGDYNDGKNWWNKDW